MKFASLEQYGLSAWRLAFVAVACASASWLAADLALGEVLGGAKTAVLVVLSAGVFYLVASLPKRVLERQRVSEAREAVLLSASARASLNVTRSRPRTLMMLKSREPALSKSITEAARLVLLGTGVEKALSESSRGLASSSAASTLKGLATLEPEALDTGDEESRGLEASGELSRETRLPMFMTVCFFAPIMLLLYAVFSRTYGAVGVSELVVLEFIMIELAFYLSSAGGSHEP